MGKQANYSYVNGTSALKVTRWVTEPDEATIIAFPGSRANAKPSSASIEETSSRNVRVANSAKRILESSEMYCSLRYESMEGVPYNLFTKRGIALLSAGAGIMAVVSLIFGA